MAIQDRLDGHTPAALLFRTLAWLAVMAYSLRFLTANIRQLGENPGWIHYPNLVFHEAGHVIFAIFGNEMLTVAGGTLMQCLVPLALMLAFLFRNRDMFAAGICLWWLGQNLVDCAPYINDARMLQLPLLGGVTGMEVDAHDWEFMLSRLGILRYDVRIARAVLAAGRMVMLLGLGWSAYALAGAIRNYMRENRGVFPDQPA